ncbi:SGNH/GDSL hydrolase family protein [Lentilitoribacter sp. EG35]|jgi:lysophospholipase L1-like esterase|uniref:SGNH/GDSL hydrolase family protein n=1 Tax=Lentilitoribacter sp. EG35 TaxID=3234192 RepID=UPI0034615231
MKNVLCFGDSLTWGFDAASGGRHALEDRWPSALADMLSDDIHVIAEGLNGRTTAFDDFTADCDRNGTRILPTLLESHQPLDLVIVLLGTNDLKNMIVGTATSSVSGTKRIISLIKNHAYRDGTNIPEILIVAPPKFSQTANTDIGAMFTDGLAQSSMLPSLLSELADELGCGFYDANSVSKTTPLDGIHMDAKNTKELGRGLAATVKLMLGL